MSWADRVRAAASKPAAAKSKPPQKSATAPSEVKKPAEEPIVPAPVEERELPAWGPPKKTAEASKAPATGNEVPPADAESVAKPVSDSKSDEAKQAAEKIAAEKAAAEKAAAEKAAAEMAAQKEAAEKAAKAAAVK